MYIVRWLRFKASDGQTHPQVPEVWQGAAESDQDEGKWWEAVDTVALDVSRNNIQTMPADIASLSETLELLNIR